MKLQYTIATVVLALCATPALSQSWREAGYHDGVHGKFMLFLSDLDFAQYSQGYKQGLSEFCHVENAVSLGTQGKKYQGVCDNTKEGVAFKTAYEDAYTRYKQKEWLKLASKHWY